LSDDDPELIFPHQSFIQYSNSTPILEQTVLHYDIAGNPMEISDKSGMKKFILWGYNYQYPIVEIQMNDYTFAQVETTIKTTFNINSLNALSALVSPNETKLKNGSLQTAMPNAQVTAYTYKPLVGVSSMTDPRGVTTYYEYDSFGRLQRTYYKENNVEKTVETYNYNYKNQ
jgi:YD repeat-containing protein